MIECVSDVWPYIGRTADICALLTIPYSIYKHLQAKKHKKLYEQLMLNVFAKEGRQIYLALENKTRSKLSWYLGGNGEKVLKPVLEFLINNTQIMPLLNEALQKKYNQILNTFNNVNEWINYPVLAKEILSFLSEVSIYVSEETSKGGKYDIS